MSNSISNQFWFGINTAYLPKRWTLRSCLWDIQSLHVWLYDFKMQSWKENLVLVYSMSCCKYYCGFPYTILYLEICQLGRFLNMGKTKNVSNDTKIHRGLHFKFESHINCRFHVSTHPLSSNNCFLRSMSQETEMKTICKWTTEAWICFECVVIPWTC